MNFDPGKDKDINASFFVHELLNKPNWHLEFQVSNSKWDKETPWSFFEKEIRACI